MNLSTKITAFLIEQNIVSKKNKEVYEYGFDLLIADFINFSTIDWCIMLQTVANRIISHHFCRTTKCMRWLSCKNTLKMSCMHNWSIYWIFSATTYTW